MPASPGGSLFASDYSLSPANSPSPRNSPLLSPRPSPRPSRSASGQNLAPPTSPSPLRTKPLEVVFPTAEEVTQTTPRRGSTLRTSISHDDLNESQAEEEDVAKEDRLTAMPMRVMRKKSSLAALTVPVEEEDVLELVPALNVLPQRKKSSGYDSFESCMEGALGHETKAASYKVGTEKAYHHLNRANDLFSGALHLRPRFPKTLLAKAKILISLATTYQTPKVAIASLSEAVRMLRDLAIIAPKSISARETLAQACALLSQTMLESDDAADDETKVWSGDIGKLAREALAALEEVAADQMDRMRALRQEEAAEQAPSMAEMFLNLASAAITVSSLASDLATVDLHVELAEQALDQASNMATVGAAARVKSSSSSANLITRVQLASGRSSLERLRHTFVLGAELDEDDFRSLMSDMSMLAVECRERAAKLKGSKQAAAATLAWEAITQLGDGKLLYANLLRLVWRNRKPRRKQSLSVSVGQVAGSKPDATAARKMSTRNPSMEAATIYEEEEEEEFEPTSRKTSETASRKTSISTRSAGSAKPSFSRKESDLSDIPDGEEVSSFKRPEPTRLGSSSFLSPSMARRGSWLPSNDGAGAGGRTRRLSSMSAPLVGPDGISAWNRKASVISLATDEAASGLVPSAELAKTAWQLLEGAIKQYKLALTLLSSSDLPVAQLARAKADTLISIGYSSLFAASLAPRLNIAREKRTSLLVTAEVYATWAAREVGWSFLIEGTTEAAMADRRTNSWRADEAGKRGVMLLMRTWWFRAVSSETIDVDTKCAAKDAVEVVVRRMKEREGVRDGDVVRWRGWIGRMEGEMDQAEGLFWRSVSRILRGGTGFVMA